MTNLAMMGLTSRSKFLNLIASHREKAMSHARSADDLEDMMNLNFPPQESVDSGTNPGQPKPQGA